MDGESETEIFLPAKDGATVNNGGEIDAQQQQQQQQQQQPQLQQKLQWKTHGTKLKKGQMTKKLEVERSNIIEIWLMCESQYQMHRLGYAYYSNRHFRNYTFPLSFITMTSGILAFSTTSGIFNDTVKQFLSLFVGAAAVVSSFIQNLGQDARNDTLAEMHKSASLGMKKLSDQLEFLQVEVAGERMENEVIGSTGYQTSKVIDDVLLSPQAPQRDMSKKTLQTYKEMYQQVLESCQSPLPVRVVQAFKMADTRLSLSMTKEDKAVIKDIFGHLGKHTIYRCLYNEVFCAISDHSDFPREIPNPDEIIDKVMDKVEDCFRGHQINFTMEEEV
jgi:hypothetical protein